uniref:Uncharacterized protein n=1 Tax=Oryza meridionalis TaxID=40149 RepID=A0A0E0E0N3_9ORYZ
MALGDERGGHPAATATKSCTGASSSSAGGRTRTRSTTTEDVVEVVTEEGRRHKVKIKNSIENTWSHGDRYASGFKCHYCTLAIKGGALEVLLV